MSLGQHQGSLSNDAILDIAAQVSYQAATNTSGFTAAASQIGGGVSQNTLNLTGTLSAAATVTLPTVAQLLQQFPYLQTGFSYSLTFVNSSSGDYTWTVAVPSGGGWTTSGTLTVSQNNWREFYVTITNANPLSPTATLQSVATGTYS